MAEGFLRKFAGDAANVFSAGIEADGLNPKAVEVMKEDDVDISRQTSNKVDEYSQTEFDFVITVCDNARENCPIFPGKTQQFHEAFEDPAKATGTEAEMLDKFRKVRDEIREFCKSFVTHYLPA